MEKISPPLRIALLAVVLLGAVWFVALRPKPPAEEPVPTPPGVAGLASGVDKAQGAAAAANASAAKSESAAANAAGDSAGASAPSATKATPSKDGSATGAKGATEKATATPKPAASTPAASKPAATPKPAAKPKAAANPAAPLVSALNRGRAVILVFRSRSSDSQAVADAARAVPKQVRRVVVRVVPISQVGRYATFTEKTQIAQAPTTLVIGPGRRAKVIVGYTSTAEIGEAVRDLRRAAKR